MYKIKTNRGVAFDITSENFDPSKFIEELNNDQLLMMAFGDIVMQKHNIESIAPDREEEDAATGTKISIIKGNDELLEAYVEDYQANAVAQAFNDHRKSFILLGDVIVNRRNVNTILPATE